LEKYIAAFTPVLSPEEKELLARIEAMPAPERWEFWQREFARCFKCYACRAACTMCYCSRCVVEDNQPQWVSVPAHTRGNFEWHVVRAMHLAGRCVGCGECGRACPMGIPLHLLSWKIGDLVAQQFGQRAGFSAIADYPLSMFRPDDQETFIR
jgi:formate dehydrogenase (coenzyme F420) beta subunit